MASDNPRNGVTGKLTRTGAATVLPPGVLRQKPTFLEVVVPGVATASKIGGISSGLDAVSEGEIKV